jgi:hypothetical protein
MSANVELVRRAIAAFNAVDVDALPEFVHPDIESRSRWERDLG